MSTTVLPEASTPSLPFCRDPIWNSSLTWYTSTPDFSRCFHSTVLVYAPCLFLWVFAPLERLLRDGAAGRGGSASDWATVTVLRLLLTGSLSALSLLQLVIKIHGLVFAHTWSSLSDVLAPTFLSVTFAFAFFLLFRGKRVDGRQSSSGVSFWFWFLECLASALTFASVLRFPGTWTGSDDVIASIHFLLGAAMFLMEFAPNPKIDYQSIDGQSENPSPEANATYPSKLFFGWYDSLVAKGWKKPIERDDLYDLSPDNACKRLVPGWERQWAKEVGAAASRSNKRPSVFWPLLRSYGGLFLYSNWYRLINIVLQLVVPSFLSLLISFVTNGEETWKGYLYVGALMFLNLAKTVTVSQYFYHVMVVGLRLRSSLTSAIYKKALNLSPAARKDRTVGETVNLMSIDTQRLMDLMMNITVVWSGPFTLVMSQYFLWQYLGPSSLAGLVVMILTLPVDVLMSKKIKKHQVRNLKNKDARIKNMNEILEGVKIMKLYAWENSFIPRVQGIRDKEVKTLRLTAVLQSVLNFIFSAIPFMVAVASFGLFVLVDPEKNILTPEIAFVSLSYFNIMRQPLNTVPTLIVQLVQASIAIGRIDDFMSAGERRPDDVGRTPTNASNAVEVRNGTFAWDPRSEPVLKGVDLTVRKGQLVAIVGKVGSGKSSLISSLSGDLASVGGAKARINVDGSVALVPQEPWIQNATLRRNVTFGAEHRDAIYRKVLDACALTPDVRALPSGDATEIGEKGINLSGGQKQRTSLARAVYSNRDVYLLDDPLSGVDARVGKHIFDRVLGPRGLLKNKSRLLVTNSVTFLPEVDEIVVLKDGRVSEVGSYDELLKRDGEFAEYLLQHANRKEEEEEEGNDDAPALSAKSNVSGLFRKAEAKVGAEEEGCGHEHDAGGRLMTDEGMRSKSIARSVYLFYFSAVGWWVALLAVGCQVATQVLSVGNNVWLSKWSVDPSSQVPAVRNAYLGVYAALGALSSLGTMASNLVVALGGLRASNVLHSEMLRTVLFAPMSFFDTNPKGRVLNRFAKDQDQVDVSIPTAFNAVSRLFLTLLGTVGAICYASPFFLAVFAPLSLAYWALQRFYLRTARQLKRIESVARSPIYSHFSESLAGSRTIRAYGVEGRFRGENEARVDDSQAAYHPNLVSNRWLSIRLEVLGNAVLLFAALVAVVGRDVVDPGVVGLSLTYASGITNTLNFLIRHTSMVESNMVSVERIKEYRDEIPQEAPHELPPGQEPEGDWPAHGRVRFDDYHARYREGMENVLKGVTCEIESEEKVGVVGRTGAGKSSLVLGLFRIVEPSSGSIEIDGRNTTQVGLGTLRSRMTVIPQDPVLFSGTLRFNLDPFDRSSDRLLWEALRSSHLHSFVSALPNGLQFEVSEGGSNLSVGQKQLICLARALLRRTKILVLDEATASVDLDTDNAIQETIRREFEHCTVITIAHRLNTVMDSNRILVVEDGKVAEFDEPSKLLEDPSSVFYQLASSAGLVAK